MLVRQLRPPLRRGTLLIDGVDDFKVHDVHQRPDGSWWYQLYNVRPELQDKRSWFSHEDCGELAVHGTRQQGRTRIL